MKNLLFILLVAIMTGTTLSSCNYSKEKHSYTIGIDLQADFKDDLVSVEIDGQNIYKKQTSTGATGVAEIIRSNYSEGLHTIRITVNDISTTDQLNLTRCQFLGVNYFSALQKIDINYSSQPISYE